MIPERARDKNYNQWTSTGYFPDTFSPMPFSISDSKLENSGHTERCRYKSGEKTTTLVCDTKTRTYAEGLVASGACRKNWQHRKDGESLGTGKNTDAWSLPASTISSSF